MTGMQSTSPLASRTAPWSRGAGWVAEGFREFSVSWGAWLAIAVILTVFSVVLTVIPVVGTFALHLLMPIFLGGLMLGLRRQETGGRVVVSDLFAGFESHAVGRLLLIGLVWVVLHTLALMIGVMVALALAGTAFLTQLAQSEDMLVAAVDLTFSVGLLIGALVYLALVMPIAMLMWFAPALVVLEGESAIPAMGHSFVGCMRNFGPYLVYGLVGLLLFPLLLIVTLGLGFLVLVPVGIASIHAGYRDIFHRP